MAIKLPPYVIWRDGRPRFIPDEPTRALGFAGQDLKTAAGEWMTYEAAAAWGWPRYAEILRCRGFDADQVRALVTMRKAGQWKVMAPAGKPKHWKDPAAIVTRDNAPSSASSKRCSRIGCARSTIRARAKSNSRRKRSRATARPPMRSSISARRGASARNGARASAPPRSCASPCPSGRAPSWPASWSRRSACRSSRRSISTTRRSAATTWRSAAWPRCRPL